MHPKPLVDSIAVDVIQAAALLSLSERAFYELLRKDPDLARKARMVVGPRCVRYKVEVLREWVAKYPETEPLPQPARLRDRKARPSSVTPG